MPKRSPWVPVLLVVLASPAGCRTSAASGDAGPGLTPRAAGADQALEGGRAEGGMVLTPSVPDDFPAALPVYPDSRVTLGGRQLTATGKRSWSLTTETADAKDRVGAYYRDSLPGFAFLSDIHLGDTSLSVRRSDAYDLDLVVGKGSDGKTTVTLDVVER